MKIAVISDIHGNIHALNEVLKDIESEKCEKIYCLGDLLLFGDKPKDTIDKIKSLGQKISLIRGNTDDMILTPEVKRLENVTNSINFIRSALSEDDINFLKSLPNRLEESIEGVSMLFVHGSPRKIDENISADLKVEEVESMIKGETADLIFCGHTHIPCGYQTNTNQTVVNVGSVGRPFTENKDGCYLVADIKNKSTELRHKFVKI